MNDVDSERNPDHISRTDFEGNFFVEPVSGSFELNLILFCNNSPEVRSKYDKNSYYCYLYISNKEFAYILLLY